MKKITFSFVFLGFVFFFSACNWKKLSPEEENERILIWMNQMIFLINEAFAGEKSVFSGDGQLLASTKSRVVSLNLTGFMAYSGQELWGEIDISLQTSWSSLTSQLFLSFLSQFRGADADLYFHPERFRFSQGEGNVDSQFVQLIAKDLLHHWIKIPWNKDVFVFPSKELLLFPQIFSWSLFQREKLEDYLLQYGEKVHFLSWSIESEWGVRYFRQIKWDYLWEEIEFSGSFDGNVFKGTFSGIKWEPLEIELKKGKNQISYSGMWWINSFEWKLSFSQKQFRLDGKRWKNKDYGENTSFFVRFSRFQQTWALQMIPDDYILLEKYLVDLDIGF